MTKVQVNSQGKVYVAGGKALLAKNFGTKSITENGTYTASSDSLDGYSSVTVNVSGGGGLGIPREVSQGVYQMPSSNFTFSLPSNATDIGDYALYYAFYNCSNLTSVSFPALTTISGSSTLYYAFYSCTSLASISFPTLTTISGSSALDRAFVSCTSLTSVSFPALTIISGGSTFKFTFRDCSGLTSVSFPALTLLGDEDSSSGASFFYQMLLDCSDVTVHFPFAMESTMSSRSDVRNGFGGTNTTVLFDLGGCITTFALTPSTGNTIVVNGEELTGTTVGLAKNSTANYEIYNSSYGLYASTYSVPDTDSATVTVDITTPTYNTISLDTSVSGLTVTATVDGITYTLPETGNTGVYTLNIYNNTGSNISVSYFVSGGSSYADATGTLTFSSTDITETITMQQAQDINFVRPNLTANGTMGGDAFAVKSGTSTTAYNAVDSSSSNYATISSPSNYEFIFYNPDALKVSELGLAFSATKYAPTNITIEGSNDNENWTSVNTWSGSASTSVTFTVDSSVYYKYHKLTFTPSGTTVRLKNLAITAVYKG